MKFGVVIFPGSNCDQDLIEVIADVTKCEVVELWHKTNDLQGCDVVFLPGGFSFGDYLRSGAIAKLSPIMGSIIEFANKGGYVVGVCNGFQILCESGLLPGALLRNDNQKFLCTNLNLSVATENSLLTQKVKKNEILTIPIAHGEGRFYASDEQIKSIEENDQVLFRYCDENGEITAAANPNGSINNIAGVCNEGRNVFGMMPHPERCSSSDLLNEDGKALFLGLMQELTVS